MHWVVENEIYLFGINICVVKIRFVEEAGIAKRVTASRYLHELAEKGFVTPMKVGAEMLFINHRLIDLLGR